MKFRECLCCFSLFCLSHYIHYSAFLYDIRKIPAPVPGPQQVIPHVLQKCSIGAFFKWDGTGSVLNKSEE